MKFQGDTIATQTITVETMQLRPDSPDVFVILKDQGDGSKATTILTPAEAQFVRDCLIRIYGDGI